MRRDTQIGIVLSIVILAIIGVFLSTRTSDKVTILPDLVLSEEGRQESKNEEIDINEFIKESNKTEPEETLSVDYSSDEAQVSEEIVETIPEEYQKKTLTETSKSETSLEGKWEGVVEETVEQHAMMEDAGIAQTIPDVEVAVIPKKELQTSPYNAPTDTIYKVQSNDSLFKIAKKYYGDGGKWTMIFNANRGSMADPNSLYVGQKLLIPNITVRKESNQVFQTPDRRIKTNKGETAIDVNTHKVEAGNTLYRLAEKYYDDPTVWIRIYEANKDTIENNGVLKEGQILIIPKL